MTNQWIYQFTLKLCTCSVSFFMIINSYLTHILQGQFTCIDKIEINVDPPSQGLNESKPFDSWWRHQMETFSTLLAICVGNSPVPGELFTQRPVTRSFDVYCDLRPNKRLSKQSSGWWFETPSRPIWRHRYFFCNWISSDCKTFSFPVLQTVSNPFHVSKFRTPNINPVDSL